MTVPAPLDQTAEERALALRLARVGPHGEPSPQLDATVLAAARAALDAPSVPSHRSRRWPVALGVAASLVLAVGVAWRLRPLPPGSTADLSAPTRPATANPPPAAAEPAGAAPFAQAAPQAVSDATIAVETPAPPPPAPHRTAKAVAAPAPDVQIDTDVAPPVILDTPSAAAAPASAPMPDAAERKVDAAPAANQAADLDRAAMSDDQPEAGDEPLDAMPPATADAPGVRDAWLSRIRALIDSGDVTGGRRSLHAFVERYPDYPLPEDLRALQQ